MPNPPVCMQCFGLLGTSPSDDFCSPECQSRWHSKSADFAILRPRAERAPAAPPYVPPATWPTAPIPHPDGGLTYPASEEDYRRWMEDTAPAEPPPEPKPLPPVPESSYPPGAVDLPTQPRWRRFLDSIRPTTRKA